MSIRFAPAASPMVMPSPVAPTESVDRMESSILGLYFTRMSRLEPKPPQVIALVNSTNWR